MFFIWMVRIVLMLGLGSAAHAQGTTSLSSPPLSLHSSPTLPQSLGLFPALKAEKLQVIEALKSE